MEHFIIGTAGHVDHGKTALIRALTGRETDNLKEEKISSLPRLHCLRNAGPTIISYQERRLF